MMKEIIQPKTKKELKKIIKKEMKLNGETCDLNHIDTSLITDMSYLFDKTEYKFNGDISKWDVSNVHDMKYMFADSNFNGDLSLWNISNVKNMKYMFSNASFRQDINNWDVSNVTNMYGMFFGALFNENISRWNVSHVKDMCKMFSYSKFNQDISLWRPVNVDDVKDMFESCQAPKPYWYSSVCDEIRLKIREKEVEELSLMLDNNCIETPKNKL